MYTPGHTFCSHSEIFHHIVIPMSNVLPKRTKTDLAIFDMFAYSLSLVPKHIFEVAYDRAVLKRQILFRPIRTMKKKERILNHYVY